MNLQDIDIEERISWALEAYKENPDQKIAELGREFEIPYQQLRGRIQGHQPRTSRIPVNKRLTDGEEAAIIEYLNRLDRLGAAATREMLRGAANYLLKQREGSDFKPLGAHWIARFLKRHPDYQVRTQKAMEKDRKQAENRSNISLWYQELSEMIDYYGINREDVWNMDETGFMIGYGRNELIVTKKGRNTTLGLPQIRESATLVEAISAGGRFIPPMVILKGKRHMAKWYDDSIPIDPKALIGVSESGFTNDELTLHWIKHFEYYTRENRVGNCRLLLLDGYGSHLTFEFIQYADQHDILLFAFPPHTTHILQPLDVVVFQPYKHYHAKAVSEAVRLGATDFKKTDFLACLGDVRVQTFKKKTIKSAFEKTGIWPFNPDRVLSQIECDPDPKPSTGTSDSTRPVTPPPQYSLATAGTPSTVRRLYRHTKALETEVVRTLQSKKMTTELAIGVLKLSKAAVAAKNSYILACRDLGKTKLAEDVRKARKIQKNRQLQAGGVITIEKGRAMKKKRDAKDN